MDACVQSVEWTIDENTTRIIEKEQNKTKDEDSIFVRAKCEKQTVKLSYIFGENSNVQEPSLNLTVPGENKMCSETTSELLEVTSKADDIVLFREVFLLALLVLELFW